ncbi:MAG: SDR family oxidoreductase [Methylococcales bacterium]
MRLLESGCRVAVLARGRTHSSVLESYQSSKELVFHQTDVRSEDDVRRAFHELRRLMGHLSYLIYSAGLRPDVTTPLADYPYVDWLDCFNTYVTGFFLCFREGMRLLEEGGHMLALSYAITRVQMDALPPFYAGHYAMAKAALDELCKWARREANARGVLLSRIAPGAVDTPAQAILQPLTGSYPMLPVSVVVEKVLSALRDRKQINEEVLPTADSKWQFTVQSIGAKGRDAR